MTAATKTRGSWGGRREGGGAKPLTDAQRLERRLRAEGITPEDVTDPVAAMAAIIGLSPRVAASRPDLAEQFPVLSPVEHVDAFLRTFCRYTQLGEIDPAAPVSLGDPFELVEHETEFLADALACDEQGRRIYKRAGLIIGRKNRKTTLAAGLSLYFGSPADGEHRPSIVQAAGVKDQAGKLYSTTRAFIDDPLYGSVALRRWFVPMTTHIVCASIGGEIKRVAGDGDNNHSLDPSVVVADELHTWKTPKQRENWKALTTAGGGRLDPFVLFITTEGDGDEHELAALMDRIQNSAATEVEHPRPGLTVYRNPDAGLLVYHYAAPAETARGVRTTIDDVETIKLANPAAWRTIERLREDLADPMVDTPTKLRLYGNIRGQGPGRWISDEAWDECRLPGSLVEDYDFIPDGSPVGVGVDGARTRDCTAVSWAWRRDDGAVLVRTRVWTCKQHKPAHVFTPGRLNNDLARDFIRDELLPRFEIKVVAYDPRYFDDQADELADEDDLTTLELTQSDEPMRDAWDDFYERVYEGASPGILHDGDVVLRAHVRNAVGTKAARGWIVRKSDDDRPIDALAAVVMGVYGATAELGDGAAEPWADVWA